MTLGFSTRWPDRMGELAGQPNYFTNKIVKGLWRSYGKEFSEFISNRSKEENKRFDRINPFEELSVYQTEQLYPKLHTIRHDTENRWKAGNDIHFVINNRTKNRFQFAPVVKCVNVQRIEIEWVDLGSILGREAIIYIDDTKLMGKYIENEKYFNDAPGRSLKALAINDGFPSVEAFFSYFNTDFKGIIIHWTDLKY